MLAIELTVKGFVPTPAHIVDLMVAKLFDGRIVSADSTVLDAGCGNGEFIAGIVRFVERNGLPVPRIVGIELDPERAATAQSRFASYDSICIDCTDFLAPSSRRYEYIIGNPPYVSIVGLSTTERAAYRAAYSVAVGRFDLYALFFEQALRMLADEGRLVFITPEKFTYVESARQLRQQLVLRNVDELHYCAEDVFDGYITYPVITTITSRVSPGCTRIVHRDGRVTQTRLPGAESWMPAVSGYSSRPGADVLTLADVTVRISCGVATGADQVFVVSRDRVTAALSEFAHPTVSGRQLQPNQRLSQTSSFMLAPYDAQGSLLAESRLGELGKYLRQASRRKLLEARTCVPRKPWYAYHDSFPISDMLRPKLLAKDIGAQPVFVVDRAGMIVPRHSVYYIVPRDPADLDVIARYLDSEQARAWLHAHCQRAANGFLRMQSHVLKRMPIPADVAVLLTGQQEANAMPSLLLA